VLHHVPEAAQPSFVKEIYTKMAPGARLVLKDIDGASFFVIFNKMHDLLFSHEIGKELSAEKAEEMARQAGFKIMSIFKRRVAVYPHYFLELEK
jgi:hypothetical protein